MNSPINSFFNSFNISKPYWVSLLIEGISFCFIAFLLTIYTALVQARTMAITGGQSIEQVKASLLQATPEAAQLFLTNIKIWVVLMLGGSLLVFLFSLFLLSYAQSAVWHTLLTQKFNWKKLYLRWSGLTIVLLIALLLYLLIYAFIRLLTNPLAALAGDPGYVIITNIITGIFMYAFILFIFLTYYSFTQKQKVWESIGHAFAIIKSKFSSISIMFLFILLTGVILSTILYYLQQKMYWSPALSLGINLIVFILFYTWMRFYLVQVVHHSS